MFSPPCGGGGNKGKNPTPTLPFARGGSIIISLYEKG